MARRSTPDTATLDSTQHFKVYGVTGFHTGCTGHYPIRSLSGVYIKQISCENYLVSATDNKYTLMPNQGFYNNPAL